jgi:hypothetical protein
MSQGRPDYLVPVSAQGFGGVTKQASRFLGLHAYWAGGTRLFTASFRALGASRQLHGDGLV